jgi:division protein CdvB (Snf7/Vps24/ESCRT-III family)
MDSPEMFLKEEIKRGLVGLRIAKSRLANAHSRIQQREKELLEKCVIAKQAKDEARAVTYAKECTFVRQLLKNLQQGLTKLDATISVLEKISRTLQPEPTHEALL